MEEVIGSSGMKAIFNMANLNNLAVELPPDDMERQFDFADFAQIFSTLTLLIGARGARSLSIRAGRSTMREGIKVFSDPLTPEKETTTEQATNEIQLIRLNRFSNFLNSISDQITTVYRRGDMDGFEFVIHQCPVCWSQTASEPICAFFEGLLEQAVKIFSNDQPYSVTETQCKASGAESCVFLLQKTQEKNTNDDNVNQEIS
ncbi:MAG: hypothetical protein HGA86_03510 [Anaerolineaceae bacterium]|nr:hypothetical protein [Anaerolineaceae bacterium]